MSLRQESLDDIPTDKSKPTPDEVAILENFFRENPSTVSVITTEVKECAVIIVLFLIFSSRQVTELIERFIPATRTNYFLMTATKCILIVVLYYFARNFSLIRKN